MGKTCFFFGHRDTPASVMPDLEREIERHILEYDVREFLVGGRGAFDSMAARAVAKAKEQYFTRRITLTRLLPHAPGSRPENLPDYFDGSWFPNMDFPLSGASAVAAAHHAAIANADYIIYYKAHSSASVEWMLSIAQIMAETFDTVLTALPPQTVPFKG